MKNLFPRNILLLELLYYDQAFLENVQKVFPQLRDFHHSPPSMAPLIHIALILAETLNSTLISTQEFPEHTRSEDKFMQKHPWIFPYLHDFDEYNSTIGFIYHKSHEIIPDQFATFVRVETHLYNFVYCSTIDSTSRKRGHTKQTLITSFFSAADLSTWLCLLSSLLSVSIISSISPKQIQTPAVLLTLSALITTGLSNIRKDSNVGNSGLFVLWTYACLLFSFFYSGSITSQLVKPSQDQGLTLISQLENLNYTIIYPEPRVLDMYRGTVSGNIEAIKNRSTPLLKQLEALDRLLNSPNLVVTGGKEFTPKLATGSEKYATFSAANVAKQTAITAQNFLRINKNIQLRRRCRLGKPVENMVSGLFFGFAPPNSDKLARNLNLLMATGIGRMWIKVRKAILTSERGPLSAVEDDDKNHLQNSSGSGDSEKYAPITVKEGRFLGTFMLWATCLGGCGLCLFMEIFSKRITYFQKNYLNYLISQ